MQKEKVMVKRHRCQYDIKHLNKQLANTKVMAKEPQAQSNAPSERLQTTAKLDFKVTLSK